MADTATLGALKRTPFYDIHRALGAKIVPFAGSWNCGGAIYKE